jgi:CheY-like chemotaxis protein
MEDLGGHGLRILVVEDNPADVRLIEEAIRECGALVHLQVVQGGLEALALCRRQGAYRNVARPHLVLLDMNLAKHEGFETLSEFKRDAALRRIPVLVLSGSSSPADIDACYEKHANCYLIKPFEMERFVRLLRSTIGFWRDVALIAT